jgi:hypothetical protein
MVKHENESLRIRLEILTQNNKVLSEQLQYFLNPAKEKPSTDQVRD